MTFPGDGDGLVDRHGRRVRYLRISITDRCDLRCQYCLPERPVFLPKSEILSLEDIAFVAGVFVANGVVKLRVTGGEPLVRRGVETLLGDLAGLDGLKELVITTNGTMLADKAEKLRDIGVNRVNVSLDTLQPGRFREITRNGDHALVTRGIEAACAAGFDAVRINTVLMRGFNDDELCDLVEFASGVGADIAFIEEMPMGETGRDRPRRPMDSNELMAILSERFELVASDHNTMGPASYWDVEGLPIRVGLIAPHSRNFCSNCNRVRLSCTGDLFPCLGHEGKVSLADAARARDGGQVLSLIQDSLAAKPKGHEFDMLAGTKVMRYMAVTGG